MDYLEIKICFEQPDLWKEIFISYLAEEGCDSFSEEEDATLLAYIPKHLYKEEAIKEMLEQQFPEARLTYVINDVPTQNWNAVWESNYAPVLIADRCYIRAPFHEKKEDVDYEIIIEPKMSFGTAHHETTSLMITYLLEDSPEGKRVLDMGAGTGVLGLLAYKRGAASVVAIDNDEWAYKNNIENNARNQAEEIVVKWGDAALLGAETFDLIIANINRNILLNDMEAYVNVLENGGTILFSGFYVGEDLEKITEKANSLHLQRIDFKEKNGWCAAKFQKSI